MNIAFFIAIIYTTVYALVNLLLGLAVLKVFFGKVWRGFPALAVVSSAFLVGQGLLAAVLLGLALTGHFQKMIVGGVLILAATTGIFVFRPWWRLSQKILADTKRAFLELSFFWKAVLAFSVLLLIFFACGAIVLPPSGDAEAFYMVLPKMVAGTGTLIPQPNYFEFSKLGFLGAAHYASLMLLADFHAAKFFVWFTALAAGGFIVSLGALFGSKTRGHLMAIAMLLTTTTFANYITDGKVDVFSAAFGLATFYWAMQTRSKEVLPLVLTGIFLGLATVAKISNLIAVLPGISLIILWNSYLEGKASKSFWRAFFGKALRSGAIIFISFLLGLLPHLIKNQTLFGNAFSVSNKYENMQWTNPVWSSGSAKTTNFVQPSSPADVPVVVTAPQAPVVKKEAAVVKLADLLKKVATYLLAFFFGDRGGQGGNLSVLVLAFLPFLFWGKLNLAQKQILTVFTISLAAWIMLRAAAITPRYILPTLLIFLPLIASKAQEFLAQKNFVMVKYFVILGLFVVIGGTLIANLHFVKRAVWAVASNEYPPALYGPYYPALQFINEKAEPNDRVMLVGYYGFFLRPDLIKNLDNEEEKMAVIFYRSPANVWQYLYEHQFKYVVIQKAPHLLVEDYLVSSNPPLWLKADKIYNDPFGEVYRMEKIEN